MSSTAISYVLSGLVFLFLVFAVSRNDNDEIAELLNSNALTIETMEQRLTDIQQTVSRQTRLAGFLTPDQVGHYKSRSSRSVQVMSMGGGGVSGASSEALNFSIQTLTVGAGADAGAAFIFEESEIFTEGEELGEILFDNGEPPLPPVPSAGIARPRLVSAL